MQKNLGGNGKPTLKLAIFNNLSQIISAPSFGYDLPTDQGFVVYKQKKIFSVVHIALCTVLKFCNIVYKVFREKLGRTLFYSSHNFYWNAEITGGKGSQKVLARCFNQDYSKYLYMYM